MTRKGKFILLIVGIFILVVVAVLFVLFRKGAIRFRADTGVISNTASLSYCLQGEGTAQGCDPANGRYTHQVNSNTVTVEVTSNPDTTPPTTSITSPTSGQTISGTVNINASASDDVGVTKVEFYWDSTNKISEDTAAPYSASWNTTSITNGSHTITTKAYDAAGNIGTSSAINVTVSNNASPINFQVTVNDRTTCANLTGKLTITPTIAPNPVDITLGSNCTFSYTPSSPYTSGQYNIIIDFNSVLKRSFSTNLPSASTINGGSYYAGDFDNNDCIQMPDWGMLFTKWNTRPVPAADAAYDLYGDGTQIGMEDWGVMFAGWNRGSLSGCTPVP